MIVTTEVAYEGDLHCRAVHGPSGDSIVTDAPADNQGRGEHFSPTDLVGTAMSTCMLTIMGIAARERGIDLSGARATVDKEMGAHPRRHIAALRVRLVLPAHLDDGQRRLMEASARSCPVAASLGSMTRVDLEFVYE